MTIPHIQEMQQGSNSHTTPQQWWKVIKYVTQVLFFEWVYQSISLVCIFIILLYNTGVKKNTLKHYLRLNIRMYTMIKFANIKGRLPHSALNKDLVGSYSSIRSFSNDTLPMFQQGAAVSDHFCTFPRLPESCQTLSAVAGHVCGSMWVKSYMAVPRDFCTQKKKQSSLRKIGDLVDPVSRGVWLRLFTLPCGGAVWYCYKYFCLSCPARLAKKLDLNALQRLNLTTLHTTRWQ